MNHSAYLKTLAVAVAGLLISTASPAADAPRQWPVEKAKQWYAAQPWFVGCNFLPSTAVNDVEMWQADTFDLETIDRELGLAAGIGMNTARVYLH